MEGWRQWQLGGRKTLSNEKTQGTYLTPTGLLMEGDYTNDDSEEPPQGSASRGRECNGDFAIVSLPHRSHPDVRRIVDEIKLFSGFV